MEKIEWENAKTRLDALLVIVGVSNRSKQALASIDQ